MRDPARLDVVEQAAVLAERTYRATRTFPASERASLSNQMRRAAVSVGSNIVEGCRRNTDNAFLSFLHIAMGSALELDYQAMIAQRLSLGDPDDLAAIRAAALSLRKMLSSLSSAVRKRNGARHP